MKRSTFNRVMLTGLGAIAAVGCVAAPAAGAAGDSHALCSVGKGTVQCAGMLNGTVLSTSEGYGGSAMRNGHQVLSFTVYEFAPIDPQPIKVVAHLTGSGVVSGAGSANHQPLSVSGLAHGGALSVVLRNAG
jgi:hypothetical protein